MTTRQHLHRGWFTPTRSVLLCASLLIATTGCDPSARRSQATEELAQQHDFSSFIQQVDERLKPLVDDLIGSAGRTSSLDAQFEEGRRPPTIAPAHFRALRAFYAQRNFRPLFTEGRHLNDVGIAVAQTIIAADEHGLHPEDFHALDIRDALDRTLNRADLPVIQGELRLSQTDRNTLGAWLHQQIGEDGTPPDLQATLRLIIEDTKNSPLPQLTTLIQKRLDATTPATTAGSELELFLADGWLRWAITQRFSNLRYITTEQAHARGWRILKDGEVYSTRQPGSPRKEAEIDPSKLRDITAEDVALTLAIEYFQAAANTQELESALQAVAPPFEDYHRLYAAAKQYRRYVAQGGWDTLDIPLGLRPGNHGPHVAALKQRLAREGYFHGDTEDESFNSSLRQALRLYQETHQLQLRNELTQETLDSLNISALRRYAQILVTLDRWRETRIGEDYDDEYILVNVPDFHAELWAEGERIHRFKTIVGATMRWTDKDGTMRVDGRTPLFSDELQYIVYNPYWNVPQSLWRRDYAQKIEEDPFWLEDNGFEIIPTNEGGQLLRQLPGPENALGMVKFLFPNEHNVYLHDTNRRELFNSSFRNFSYGCVRIEDALGFAALLTARDRGISMRAAEEFVEEMLAKNEEQWTTLRTYIPVHIEYYTVRVDDDGYTNFLADFHRYDAPLVDAREAQIEAYFSSLHGESASMKRSEDGESDAL